MLGAALTPLIVTLVMWINVIYELLLGNVLLWWEWTIIVTWTIGTISYLIHRTFK